MARGVGSFASRRSARLLMSLRSGRKTPCWLLGLLFLLTAWTKAQAQAPVDAGPATQDAKAEVADAAPSRADALQRLIAGEFPGVPLKSLLDVALTDEASVERRKAAVTAELRTARRQLQRMKRKGAADQASRDQVSRAIELLSRELAVLSLPLVTRADLVAQEEAFAEQAQREAEAEEQRKAEAEAQQREAAEAAKKSAQLAQDRERAVEAAKAALDTQRALLSELEARLQAVRAAQLAFESKLKKRSAVLTEQKVKDPLVAQLAGRIEHVAPETPDADALYGQLVQLLREIRSDLQRQLDGYDEPIEVPTAGELSVPLRTPDELGATRFKLQELRAELAGRTLQLQDQAQTLRFQELDQAMARERALNELRIVLLARVSESKRDAVLGFGEEGRAQLSRELYHIQLVARWVALSWRRQLSQLLAQARSLRQVGNLLFDFSLVAFALWLGRRLRSERSRLLELARTAAARLLRVPRRIRVAHGLLGALDAIYVELSWLLVVVLCGVLLGSVVESGFPEAFYSLSVLYASYRLVLSAAHRFLAWLAGTEGRSAVQAAALSSKILHSVRVVGRYGLALFLVLSFAEAAVERGYLYHLTVLVAWLAALPLALWLVRRWRTEICDAYLAIVRSEGAFADTVRRSRDQWYGFAIALVAFVLLIPTTAIRWARRFVLGFERSRKALAYLLRRRLERKEEASSPADSLAPGLPRPVLAALTTEPVLEASPLLVEFFPGAEQLKKAFEAWRMDGGIGATLLVGKAGFGKTTWLHAAVRQVSGAAVCQLSLAERTTDPNHVRSAIAQAAALEQTAAETAEALAEALCDGPRRLFWIDDLHMWFARKPSGLSALLELERVISLTGHHVYWLASMAHHPFEFMRWMRRDFTVFRNIIRLPAWGEAQIADLIGMRMKASGFEVSYEELLLDEFEGVEAAQQLLTTARDYNRLVWDYSDGSPRAALEVWRSSLVVEDKQTLSVRLFSAPSASELDGLDEVARFSLGGIAWHGSIATDELADSLRFPIHAVQDEVAKLVERGVVSVRGRYLGIHLGWWPVVSRYLKRKHLIGG